MQKEILIAGFGGQGVLFAGQVIAYAAMDSGKEVTWIPSYGPEMRGGTANCIVIVADGKISSPIVTSFDTVIALNQPSLDKFEPSVTVGGLIVANQSMMNRAVKRGDLKVVTIPATEIAHGLGNVRVANSVILGALIAATAIGVNMP